MNILVLTTGTNNTPALYEPLEALGHKLTVEVYDAKGKSLHHDILRRARANPPRWILYIGAIPHHHGKPVPDIAILRDLGEVAPMVHLCCDGAEDAWWELLGEYYAAGVFALQVNIDGVRAGPIGARGMTSLAPIDFAKHYRPIPWLYRPTPCAFWAFPHGHRDRLGSELQRRGVVTYRQRSDAPYEDYASFLMNSRAVLNLSTTGGGKGQHVKARVLEAAAAGAVLLEPAGSPTAAWFRPGVDYLTYRSIDEAVAQIDWITRRGQDAQLIAKRLRGQSLAYTPAIFWSQVMWRLGLIPIPLADERDLPVKQYGPAQIEGLPTVAGTSAPAGLPVLLGSLPGRRINLVAIDGVVLAVPQSLGPLDLSREENRTRPGILTFDNEDAARGALA